ncbi:chalcone isomerase family protein [Endozoicomonas sp. 8E]|uniref:chalcone isomerase family protein n=1 Tax=Endozoicomonas sp. 8E TaxID=3035692 RepID=UPI002939034D|nr:chalcone isomerase family protein [Endozoicomonas sp. 8E]WOG29949.1 chalcone isomerase family protein [Endozoicomonas sp. 8E]
MKKLFIVAFGMALWQSAQALSMKGMEIPDVVKSDDTVLQLQGAAVRTWYLVVDGYIGALYLENPTTDVSRILSEESYQRMSFTILLSKMSARRMANAFYEAIQINTSEEEQKELEKGIAQFMDMIDGTLKKGESGTFEYIPGKGARVIIAGEEKGTIPGKKLFNAILKVWIGETPPNQKFKEDILGLNAKG